MKNLYTTVTSENAQTNNGYSSVTNQAHVSCLSMIRLDKIPTSSKIRKQFQVEFKKTIIGMVEEKMQEMEVDFVARGYHAAHAYIMAHRFFLRGTWFQN